jgi:ribokinase
VDRPPRIVVVGSANVDLTTFTARLPNAGETIFGDRFDLGWGGKGANQAVAARLCSADVAMVGCVGADLFGPAMIANLQAQGIDTSHVRVLDDVSTGVAPIFVEPDGQNRIVVVKGANDRLTPAAVDEAAALFEWADGIVVQFEVPLETVYHTIDLARRRGVRCIVNPAPAQPIEMSAVAGADYFVPNESEAELIARRPVRSLDDARACAQAIVDTGLPRVIITLGDKGAMLASADGVEVIPGFAVSSIDSSGAGDAFVGSLAVFLAEGVDERHAIRRANLFAALSTMSVGTQKSFVTRARFEEEWSARGQRFFPGP